ncbi:hypothetical protein ATHL_01331 [Anaerolinea thermolimosa]|uniref:hypothetical protein n=1 Tax=Anaerolinea thermolimosa TaxID=229919 RepID=UPI0007814274|nr:hypothetical protein [Anaerolinea thermolimosa]GAP06477.1 hypothetical protein ATHL_01331 [Anaerolinea thermolimosa]
MQIFNIGPVELILILLIMFILLGPEGMLRTARQIGSWIRALVRSPVWRDIMGYSKEIRELPTKIVRETGLDEDLEEIRKTTAGVAKDLETTVDEANKEIEKSIKEANQQIEQSLKETGKVEVRIDPRPPSESHPITSPVSSVTSASSNNGGEPATISSPPIPPAQTYHKYSSADDEEEEE